MCKKDTNQEKGLNESLKTAIEFLNNELIESNETISKLNARCEELMNEIEEEKKKYLRKRYSESAIFLSLVSLMSLII